MTDIFPSREYITFRFGRDEELLVPKGLLEKSMSKKLNKMIAESHNNEVNIHEVALSVFEDAIRFMTQEQISVPEENLQELLKAAKFLELAPLEQKIKETLRVKIFPDH